MILLPSGFRDDHLRSQIVEFTPQILVFQATLDSLRIPEATPPLFQCLGRTLSRPRPSPSSAAWQRMAWIVAGGGRLLEGAGTGKTDVIDSVLRQLNNWD